MGDSPTTHDELCMYYSPLQGYLTILFRILFISFVYVKKPTIVLEVFDAIGFEGMKRTHKVQNPNPNP